MDVITAAIDEAGVFIRPFHDGPMVRAVKDGIAREPLLRSPSRMMTRTGKKPQSASAALRTAPSSPRWMRRNWPKGICPVRPAKAPAMAGTFGTFVPLVPLVPLVTLALKVALLEPR